MIRADPSAPDDGDLEILRAHPAFLVTASAVIVYRVPHVAQVTSPDFPGSFSPHWHIQPMRRAGTPAISAYGATSRFTTAPAPMKQYSPSVVPHTMVAFAPIDAPRFTSVRRYSFFRD